MAEMTAVYLVQLLVDQRVCSMAGWTVAEMAGVWAEQLDEMRAVPKVEQSVGEMEQQMVAQWVAMKAEKMVCSMAERTAAELAGMLAERSDELRAVPKVGQSVGEMEQQMVV